MYSKLFTWSLCKSFSPGFGIGIIKGFLPWITFLRVWRFFVCFFYFHRTLFVGLSLCKPWKYVLKFSFCAFTCLSNDSLISWQISARLGSALPPSMLYLSYHFQPKESTWMCLWKVIALQVDFCHNLDPWQMIYINFLHNLYWCIILHISR